jgi:hypothetical protein
MADREREALTKIVKTYDDYRRRGVAPAPAEYAHVVEAIESARAALSTPRHEEPAEDTLRLEWLAMKGYCVHTHLVPDSVRYCLRYVDSDGEARSFGRWHLTIREAIDATRADSPLPQQPESGTT